MRICLLSKFPPIQGGISARTYWMAQGFAERGIETHVVMVMFDLLYKVFIENRGKVPEGFRISDLYKMLEVA